MQVLLDRHKYLVGIHGLDQVVGNVVAYSLVHDVLFLALGDHDYGRLRRYLLDTLQSLKSGKTGHVLVENYHVEMARLHELEGVVAVVHRYWFVAFRAEKHYVGFEQVDLVVGPEYRGCHCGFDVLAG